MFTYFARLHEGHGLPVYPVVIFSYDAPRQAAPHRYSVEFPGFTVLQFNYQVVQLNRLNWRDFLRQPNPLAHALMAKMQVAPAERAQVKLECLRLILTGKLNPAKMQMLTGFVDTYLRLTEDEDGWVDANLADLVPKESFMEWITPFERWGEIKGRKAGRLEGILAMFLRQYKHRFGLLNEQVETRVRALSLPQLEELSEALLDFNEAADLPRWLDDHPAEAEAPRTFNKNPL
jgi:hypothetical protein